MLLNLILDQIIAELKLSNIGQGKELISLIANVDDTFIKTAKVDVARASLPLPPNLTKYKLQILIANTYSVIISKEPLCCKLFINNKTI